ncbi:phage tail protein [Aeromonas veronii]|uniref:phage tail protein n=1 Tax=Aeromonas veronii TaxID=654 RepID=UPI003B9E0B93
MSAIYFAIPTHVGQAKISNALALGVPLKITHMAVGDGNGQPVTPDPAQTKLVRERRRAPLNALFQDPLNPAQLVAQQIIPENEGGWWIHEIGLFDESGTMIAIANAPPTYKPQMSEGSGRTQGINVVLIVSDTSAVELKIDPSVVLATRKYVDDVMKAHKESRDHPSASTSEPGLIKLATQAEVDAAVDEGVAVPPKRLANHYKRSNILGPVGLSAGIPTGSIIESGSNANGSYTKLADGNMIVRKSITFPQLTLAADTFKVLDLNGVTAWPWPARFSEYPEVSVQFVGAQSYAFQVQAENIDPVTVGSFHLRNHWFAQMVTSPKIQVIAIGKW